MTRRPAAFLIAALLVTPALALAPLGTAQAKDAEVATVVADRTAGPVDVMTADDAPRWQDDPFGLGDG